MRDGRGERGCGKAAADGDENCCCPEDCCGLRSGSHEGEACGEDEKANLDGSGFATALDHGTDHAALDEDADEHPDGEDGGDVGAIEVEPVFACLWEDGDEDHVAECHDGDDEEGVGEHFLREQAAYGEAVELVWGGCRSV